MITLVGNTVEDKFVVINNAAYYLCQQ